MKRLIDLCKVLAWAYRVWMRQPELFNCAICGETRFLRRNAADTMDLDTPGIQEEESGGILRCRRGHRVGTWTPQR